MHNETTTERSKEYGLEYHSNRGAFILELWESPERESVG